MNKPHKHAEVIKAWADGAEIEFRNPNARIPAIALPHEGRPMDWTRCTNPTWQENCEYRVKPPPFEHKWKKEIEAYILHGKEVQRRLLPHGKWEYFIKDGTKLTHEVAPRRYAVGFDSPFHEFRIKPEPVVQDVCIRWLNNNPKPIINMELGDNYKSLRNVRFTFEDGVLVDAEVLK